MLERLYIENFILIETAEVHFQQGLNVITGETGAGKTSLLQALRFAMGEKSDTGFIRHGQQQCLVEASFCLKDEAWLETLGIACQSPVVIKRILHTSGKSRAFVNCQAVTQKTLSQVALYLLEIISQETTYTLRLGKVQTEMLDRFAGTLAELKICQTKKTAYGQLEQKHQQLLELQQKKIREEDLILFQLQELKDHEIASEEALNIEHTALAKKMKSQDMAKTLLAQLEQAKDCLLGAKQLCRQLDVYETVKAAEDGLQEALYTLETKTLLDERDFTRFAELEKSMAKISRLKKKYGSDIEQVNLYQERLEKEYQQLAVVDESLAKLEHSLKQYREEIKVLEQIITAKRMSASPLFAQGVLALLGNLNLQADEFIVELDENGAQFSLKNTAKLTSIAHDVSGGELARITLAIKTLLAENNTEACLFFDEIDAHIGGQTALKMALVLKELGKYRQVICITHFPQVASCADSHIRVEKHAHKACVKTLDSDAKKLEILRMMGGESLKAHF